MRYEHLLNAILSTPFAMCEPQLSTLAAVVVRRVVMDDPTDPDWGPGLPDAAERGRGAPEMHGDVAVLPLYGTIFPRANLVTQMSGGTSAEEFARRYQALMEDNDVKAVVLDVDSPGGSVAGVPEAAEVMFRLRGRKPVVAQVNHLMASAAYYLASQVDEIVCSPSGQVGSVGVVMVHEAIGRQLEEQGVDTTFIFAGRFKVEGNEVDPLGDEARAYFQSQVDDYYGGFVRAVARGRGASPATVRADYGQGRMMLAAPAQEAGLVDRVATLDQTIARLRSAQGRSAANRRRANGETQVAGIDMGLFAGIDEDDARRIAAEVVERGVIHPIGPVVSEHGDMEALAASVLEESA